MARQASPGVTANARVALAACLAGVPKQQESIEKQRNKFFLCTFLWRKEKYPKETLPSSLATPSAWLPSRKRFFRRGQELAHLWWAQTACPLFPKKPPALGCAAMGMGNRLRSS